METERCQGEIPVDSNPWHSVAGSSLKQTVWQIWWR